MVRNKKINAFSTKVSEYKGKTLEARMLHREAQHARQVNVKLVKKYTARIQSNNRQFIERVRVRDRLDRNYREAEKPFELYQADSNSAHDGRRVRAMNVQLESAGSGLKSGILAEGNYMEFLVFENRALSNEIERRTVRIKELGKFMKSIRSGVREP